MASAEPEELLHALHGEVIRSLTAFTVYAMGLDGEARRDALREVPTLLLALAAESWVNTLQANFPGEYDEAGFISLARSFYGSIPPASGDEDG